MTMRTIDLVGLLDEAQGFRIARAIKISVGRSIDVRIDSPGGKFGAAIAIALEIEEHDAPVFTTVVGQANSAAGLVAMAGDLRRIDRDGVMLIHHPSPRGSSASADVAGAIGEYSGRPLSVVRSWMDGERTFDAHEAMSAGLIDRIINTASPEPVRLRQPTKRPPTRWLRSWREFYEQHDARCA